MTTNSEKPAVRFLRIMGKLDRLAVTHSKRIETNLTHLSDEDIEKGYVSFTKNRLVTKSIPLTAGHCLYCYVNGGQEFHKDQSNPQGFWADTLSLFREEDLEESFLQAFQERMLAINGNQPDNRCSIYSDNWFLNWLANNV